MKRTVILGFGLFVALGASYLGAARLPGAPASQQTTVPAPMDRATGSAASQRAVLDKYCVTCHSDRLKTAGLTLQTLDVNRVATDAPTWEKVVRKLRSGSMPPPAMPRPDPATYNGLVSFLETSLDKAAAAA